MKDRVYGFLRDWKKSRGKVKMKVGVPALTFHFDGFVPALTFYIL
jgi:hypothetical protein